MCEHEFVFGRINATHCKRCNDTEQEIILREQLAAANARVTELEKERNNYLSFGQGGASFTDSQWLDKLASAEQRAEQAEAELAELKKQNAELFPYYQDHLEGALIPATEYQQWIKRAEQAEAQCTAMETAINRYVLGNIALLDALKAALEEKP